LGGIIIHFNSIWDGCDGEIARQKLRRTKYGGYLDSFLDRYVDAAIILGLTYGYWSISGDSTIWIMGFAAIIGSFINTYTGEKYDSVFKTESGTGRIKFRVGRDVRLLIIVVGALTNQIPILLIIVAVLANFEAIRRLILFRNKLGDDVTDTHIEFAN
jgi:CDP-L-myo-inositol myo-inositolphosphotransferase